MKLKKITRIKDLSYSSAQRLSNSFEKEGYKAEIAATYLSNVGTEYCQYELNIYKQITRDKRWFTI